MKTLKAKTIAPILVGILAAQFAAVNASANPNEKTVTKPAPQYIDYLALRDSVIKNEMFPWGIPDDDDWYWFQEQRYLLVKDAQILGQLKPTCYQCSLWNSDDA